MYGNFIAGIVIIILGCMVYQIILGVNGANEPRPIRVIYDPDNGCQYVVSGNSVTPRLDPFGKQVCKHDN